MKPIILNMEVPLCPDGKKNMNLDADNGLCKSNFKITIYLEFQWEIRK